ncbi:hypothetical protein, partial [Nostoc sp. CCY0012]|uniref:hypothetical protein n=1 Tax=Nostoc sp. CCY0012 TaxID=1056123 RepID=UPI0039C762E2
LLPGLANKLPQVLPEALAAAKHFQDGSNRFNLLTALASKLPPNLLREALAAAKEIRNEEYRANALKVLADKLPPNL